MRTWRRSTPSRGRNSLSEPWLSGGLQDVNPAARAVLFSLEQIRLDIAKWTAGITTGQAWSAPAGLAPVAFQVRHIAGSVDRLFTYAEGRQLSDQQMAELRSESEPGEDLAAVVARMNAILDRVSASIRVIDAASYGEPRGVGRKQLPTTVIGLLFHLAEHSQRHAGLAIATAKVLRSIE